MDVRMQYLPIAPGDPHPDNKEIPLLRLGHACPDLDRKSYVGTGKSFTIPLELLRKEARHGQRFFCAESFQQLVNYRYIPQTPAPRHTPRQADIELAEDRPIYSSPPAPSAHPIHQSPRTAEVDAILARRLLARRQQEAWQSQYRHSYGTMTGGYQPPSGSTSPGGRPGNAAIEALESLVQMCGTTCRGLGLASVWLWKNMPCKSLAFIAGYIVLGYSLKLLTGAVFRLVGEGWHWIGRTCSGLFKDAVAWLRDRLLLITFPR